MSAATGFPAPGQEDLAIAEKKSVALTCITEAWETALAEGVDAEIIAHAALFTALSDLISTYGEEAVAALVERLPDRVRTGEFTLDRLVQ